MFVNGGSQQDQLMKEKLKSKEDRVDKACAFEPLVINDEIMGLVPNSMDVPHQDWKRYRIKFQRNMGSKKFNLMVYKYMRGGSKPIHVVVFKVPHGVPANDARVLSALDVC